MTTTDLEPAAWRKFESWFFRECNEGTRRHLYAMFDMPLDEIRNHGHERHVLNHIRRKLQSADQLQALVEELDRLREEVERLRKAASPEWFYLGDDCSSDQCRFGIYEVIDEDYFWDKRMEGDHVVEIATATSCPTIWAAVHCYTEAEKDELQTDDDYSVVEYATEAEARAALAGGQ